MPSSAMFSIKMVPTFRDLAGKFAKAERAMLEQRRIEVQAEAMRMVDFARDEAPRRSGKFAAGISYRTFTGENSIGFRVYTPQPLGSFIILGTKPHIIRARRAKALRFFWAKGFAGPGIYFFQFVHHPGTKPNSFMGRAYRRWHPGARAMLNRISTRYITELKK